jgi:alpha-beta hydrolase superfamily lysophospholipase
MPDTIFRMPALTRYLTRAAAVIAAIVLVIYLVRAFDSRRLPDLGTEYRIHFDSEFQASDEAHTDWDALLKIEDELAEELARNIDPELRPDRLLDRYSASSLTNPHRFDGDWNRSYELTAAEPGGVAVMLHGLTDSPYSMLPTAQSAVGAGYNVIVPRMPGHGFAVGGLLQARWEDWAATVRIAIRRAMEIRAPEQPLLIVGYSNGGLLAVNYALRCQDDDELPCPDRIVLLSPAISVSPAAIVSNWHSAISWIPYFEKFQWLSVLPEIDPFKFTSFPKRAGREIYELAKRTNALLRNPGRTNLLPPMLTFQSLVDNTVSSDAVVSRLYRRLPRNGSEIIVYDINRNSTVVQLMRNIPHDPIDFFKASAPLHFGVTILRNSSPKSLNISVASMAAGERSFLSSETSLKWPPGVFSLSHISIPFPSIDPLYGDGKSAGASDAGIVLGAIAPRGELGILSLSSDYFLRTRYNPFFSFQARHIAEWLATDE